MKERPIIFKPEMVKAILDGNKTQTRRAIKPQPPEWINEFGNTCFTPKGSISGRGNFGNEGPAEKFFKLPCQKGDVLWVRETWADVNTTEGPAICYKADESYWPWEGFSKVFGPDYGAGPSMDYDTYPGDYCMWVDDLIAGEPDHNWKPSIHMWKWACRLFLRVESVTAERLVEISKEDALAEGVSNYHPRRRFKELWDSINGKPKKDKPDYSWKANPWIWVIKFGIKEIKS